MKLVMAATNLNRSARRRGMRPMMIAPKAGTSTSAGRSGKLGSAPVVAASTPAGRAVRSAITS
jgi:hypothetical protein